MKTVLLISYYWPPNGGVGIIRWLHLAKYLSKQGWKVIVFTADNDNYYLKDDIPIYDENITVIKEKIFEPVDYLKKKLSLTNLNQGVALESSAPSKLEKLLLWIRGNLIIPDTKIFWIRRIFKQILELLDTHSIDIIVSTGPPHSMHLLGKKLQKATKKPWIADFRDPWTNWELLDQLKVGKWARFWHRRKEKKVLKKANFIVTVSKSWKHDFEDLGADCITIPNAAHARNIPYNKTSQFTLVYTGLLNYARNSKGLWEALKHLYEHHEIWKIKAKVCIYGNVSSILKEEIEEDKILQPYIKFIDYTPYKETLSIIHKSDLLINSISLDEKSRGNIPMKLYEYLLSSRPILNLCDESFDAAQIVKRLKGVFTIHPHETEMILEQLLRLFNQWYIPDDDFRFERPPFYTYHQTARQWNDLLLDTITNDE